MTLSPSAHTMLVTKTAMGGIVMRTLLMMLFLSLALGQPALAQAPDVGPEFQEEIDEALREVTEGVSPSRACAGLKGSVHGQIRYQGQTDLLATATPAIQACELEVPIRYFETYLDRVVAGEHSCIDFMSHFTTEMGAVNIRMSSIEDIEPKETEPLILKVLAERIRGDCPDVAQFMLRGL